MPISQDRMITIVNAAITYRNLLRIVSRQLGDPRFPDMTHAELLAEIQIIKGSIDGGLIEHGAEYNEPIAIEYHNFRKNAARNENYRIREQIKRRERGIIPRAQYRASTQSDKLLTTNEFINPSAPDSPLTQPRAQKHLLDSPDFQDELAAHNALIDKQNAAYVADQEAHDKTMAEIAEDTIPQDQPLTLLIQEEDDESSI